MCTTVDNTCLLSRCPPMRCVALQAGLPIVRGGLYAPWGRSHMPIRLAAAGPGPSHGPSPLGLGFSLGIHKNLCDTKNGCLFVT